MRVVAMSRVRREKRNLDASDSRNIISKQIPPRTPISAPARAHFAGSPEPCSYPGVACSNSNCRMEKPKKTPMQIIRDKANQPA